MSRTLSEKHGAWGKNTGYEIRDTGEEEREPLFAYGYEIQNTKYKIREKKFEPLFAKGYKYGVFAPATAGPLWWEENKNPIT